MAEPVGKWPGGKSARALGSEFGLTARDMNALLKEHGYLDGKPGAYGLTEKGKQFGEERHHSNGVGGYSQYQVNYETRGWNDDLPAALRADMVANPKGVHSEESIAEPDDEDEYDSYVAYNDSDDGPDLSLKEIAFGFGVFVAGILVVRYGPPLWNNKVKPAAKRLREKFSKRGTDGPTALDPTDAPE